ncbi:MAG: NAD(P)-dependent oxidoreductase [Candidatus Omnitrophica bacterium]|nr:NAD(P)-dependent oxidoreductase [Candidatus Omnitrophota bacterium]
MKILITGSTGLLGQALVSRLASRCDVTGLSRHAPAAAGGAAHLLCDLTDAGATERAVRAAQPEAVLHSQALSDVDRCELDPQDAERHNPPNPVSVYGRTKLAGEQAALAYPLSVVIRPSSLFGPGRMNFCDQVVARARRQEPVEAYVDQATSPSYTEDVADGVWALLTALQGRGLAGQARIYHVVNAGGCRRVEFVERVLALTGAPRTLLRPIRMADQRRPARRPPYSVLTSRHLPPVIGRTLRPWDEALHAYLQQRRWLN